MRSTFAGFTTAQLALRASQYGLDVTGQNISNVNTNGYTRQVVDQISLNLQNAGRYATVANVGYGTLVTGVSQVRDPYLDIRFRNEVAKVGEADVKLAGLQEIESILDEIAKDGIQTQLSDLNTMLQKLSSNVSSKEYENMVKSSAESLTKYLNQCAKQLETIRSNHEYNLTEVEVPEINNILENIAELNKSIKNGQINGTPALELLDQRNVLIDQLASYMKINVTYVPTKISDSLTIDELKIDLVGENNTINLLNHLDHVNLEIPSGTTQLNIVDKDGNPVKDANDVVIGEDIFSELSTGSLKGNLEFLNSSGEFDGANNSFRGIGYYQQMLDLMATKLATTFNDINNTGLDPADLHDMFASSDGGTITAKTICIASGWENSDYGLTASVTPDGSAPASGANDNILKMINALQANQSFVDEGTLPDDSDDITMFTGTFHEFISNLNTTLGIDIKSTKSSLNNYVSVANEITDAKSAISSVSLDEEGMNLIRYQQSYAAAARLMTTLDEAVDTLINKMGIVGR
ncbi:flagellar hook-associated protein 1 [Anaerotignum neopropionicum]|uniref:Flagellar hook-associated protein 1 n=1 Tax=Anaerotignum neopropionicum TaxID=36847 RepID=A0A136WC32_9FIRM|nr:flagellar hook-associated protein FlgK [Anaerotignum neopropionicum]KXL52078.1 flagellar hook-associated protein 1 [Anaerotignum neopropionicum]